MHREPIADSSASRLKPPGTTGPGSSGASTLDSDSTKVRCVMTARFLASSSASRTVTSRSLGQAAGKTVSVSYVINSAGAQIDGCSLLSGAVDTGGE